MSDKPETTGMGGPGDSHSSGRAQGIDAATILVSLANAIAGLTEEVRALRAELRSCNVDGGTTWVRLTKHVGGGGTAGDQHG